MSLVEVKHQGAAQQRIQRALALGRVPHAYVLHGPDGVGKEMFAAAVAQLLLCELPKECALDEREAADVGIDQLRTACGDCDDCRMIRAGTHPDLHLIYRQLNRDHPDPLVRKRKGLDLGVDVLRHFLMDKVYLTPARGRAKVFVVREADRITTQAQNALLKTLEEPPGTTYLMLLVRSLDRMLPTTLSRCQLLEFAALPTAFVQSTLRTVRHDLSDEQVTWYASFAEGSVGRALSAADDDLIAVNQRVVDHLIHLHETRGDVIAAAWTEQAKALGSVFRKRDPEITDTEATRRGLLTIFHLAANWFADVLRVSSCDEAASIVNASFVEELERAGQQVDTEAAAERINRIASAERNLHLNANTQLVVEALVGELAEPVCV